MTDTVGAQPPRQAMPVPPPAPATDRAQRFAKWLQEFVEQKDRGALAALRRGLGKEPGEAAEMFPHLMCWISEGTPRWSETVLYLVASLFAWHPQSWPGTRQPGKLTNPGASFAHLRQATDSASTERYFIALLNSHREDLPVRLRRAVGLLRAHDIPVDWAHLVRDLSYWDAATRAVQRRWARAFWGDTDTATGGSGATADTGRGEEAEARHEPVPRGHST